ncbi:pectinesterase inhibitor 9-like [Zingiber officinale]|uniref:pectinesterase inhibitor 9-like n=1 Tax=Zingiber officinale TaxID=94328 RepID=UPI001C4D708A|nr:pectinesterase inhibitor 9-like [Zingiber officinale]
MERCIAAALVLLASAVICVSASAAPAIGHRASGFIRYSCRATRYPHVCERSLSAIVPPVRRSARSVATAALAVSAVKARSASAFVGRMCGGKPAIRTREAGAVRDCLETMSDSFDRLRRSIHEIRRMGPARTPRFAWHLSNVQTWVSAALTDESTCLDGLSQNAGPAVRAAIRKRVVSVAQVTSNALALVNRLQPRT